MTTEEILIQQFGATLTLRDLAAVIKSKSANAVRVRMYGKDEFASRLRGMRKHHGRRIYFLTREVVELIDPKEHA